MNGGSAPKRIEYLVDSYVYCGARHFDVQVQNHYINKCHNKFSPLNEPIKSNPERLKYHDIIQCVRGYAHENELTQSPVCSQHTSSLYTHWQCALKQHNDEITGTNTDNHWQCNCLGLSECM